jgi:hypothetical protein
VLTVVFGGLWLQHQLDDAKQDRCQLAYGQIKVLRAEINVFQVQIQALPADQLAAAQQAVQSAVDWVSAECGPIPS